MLNVTIPFVNLFLESNLLTQEALRIKMRLKMHCKLNIISSRLQLCT